MVIYQIIKKMRWGSLRENGILKTDTKEKANICNRQFQSAFTREDDSDRPQKGLVHSTPRGMLCSWINNQSSLV